MGTHRQGHPKIGTGSTLSPGKSRNAFDTTGALALIHNAIAHLVGPIDHLPKVLPALERIAVAIEESRDIIENVTSGTENAYRNGPLSGTTRSDSFKTPVRLDPTPVAVIDERCRFVAANDSYCSLYGSRRKT